WFGRWRTVAERLFRPLPTWVRTLFRTIAARLSGLAGIGAGASFLVRRRLPLRSPGVSRPRSVPWTGFLPLDRCRCDQNSHARTNRNENRGNDALDRSGRTENSCADAAGPDSEHH